MGGYKTYSAILYVSRKAAPGGDASAATFDRQSRRRSSLLSIALGKVPKMKVRHDSEALKEGEALVLSHSSPVLLATDDLIYLIGAASRW